MLSKLQRQNSYFCEFWGVISGKSSSLAPLQIQRCFDRVCPEFPEWRPNQVRWELRRGFNWLHDSFSRLEEKLVKAPDGYIETLTSNSELLQAKLFDSMLYRPTVNYYGNFSDEDLPNILTNFIKYLWANESPTVNRSFTYGDSFQDSWTAPVASGQR